MRWDMIARYYCRKETNVKGIRPPKKRINWLDVFFIGGLLTAIIYALYRILHSVGYF